MPGQHPSHPGQGAGSRAAKWCTWEGSQNLLPTLLWAVLSPLCYARWNGTPTFKGNGDKCPWDGAQPCRVWSQPQPCWLGGDSSSTPRQPQMKSVASAGNLGPAVLGAPLLTRGTDPRALAGKSDVPSTTSLPVPKPLLGQPTPARHTLWCLPLPTLIPCLPWGAMEQLGWSAPSFIFHFVGWFWATAAPTTVHRWKWSLLHQPSLWVFSGESKANKLLWGWVQCWWEW